MKGAELLIKILEEEGVDVVFGYPGGAILPVYDALLDANFEHILCRHEQGCALAADAYARVTGKTGVCISTSGPGATNLLTGLANAWMDSIPMVAITGQVATPLMGTDAFQEVDILGMSMPVVKHSFQPKEPGDLGWMLSEAFQIANTGRPGPVLIDIPKDIAAGEVPNIFVPRMAVKEKPGPDFADLDAAIQLLKNSKQPIIYAGGGIALGNMVQKFRKFVATTQIPVVTTLKGIGTVSGKHPLNLGMLGMHGTKAANISVQQCDLLIAIGARFDDRATGKLAEFAPDAKVIHMDMDPAELGKLRNPSVALPGSLEHGLNALSFPVEIEEWREKCLQMKRETAWDYQAPGEGIYAPRLLHKLSQRCDENTIIACDVGQHQMWVAQHYRFEHPAQHLTSGGLGTMGYGMPAAIGAQLAKPNANVINVSGDGSIMMNIQELATIKRYKLPVKILLFDNQRLGMVRQWQELFFDQRFSAVDLSDNPDFVQVAESFGIPAKCFYKATEEDALIDLLVETEGPLLVHCLIDERENVWPLVPAGKSNAVMMDGKPMVAIPRK